MTAKIMGAILIISTCGGFGFSLAAAHKREEKALNALLRACQMMICELEYKQPPLPELCRLAAEEAGGIVGQVFQHLSAALETQISGDVGTCMKQVLTKQNNLPSRTAGNLLLFGQSMGRFALSGQLTELKSMVEMCKRDIQSLSVNRDARLRSYATLGICCGVALVVLFI